jgi:hypothetical protein
MSASSLQSSTRGSVDQTKLDVLPLNAMAVPLPSPSARQSSTPDQGNGIGIGVGVRRFPLHRHTWESAEPRGRGWGMMPGRLPGRTFPRQGRLLAGHSWHEGSDEDEGGHGRIGPKAGSRGRGRCPRWACNRAKHFQKKICRFRMRLQEVAPPHLQEWSKTSSAAAPPGEPAATQCPAPHTPHREERRAPEGST